MHEQASRKLFKKIIRSFELGLNPEIDGLDYMIIHETDKDYTKIIFHNDVINEAVSDGVFNGKEDGPQPVSQWWKSGDAIF